MSLLLGPEPFQKFGVGHGWWVVGRWWWLKGILEFRFGPNIGLRLEAGTKLKNKTKWHLDLFSSRPTLVPPLAMSLVFDKQFFKLNM